MIELAKQTIKLKGNISNLECTHICKDCIFSRRKNNDITCCMDTPENYLKIAEEYLKNNEDVKVERKMSLKEKILAKIDYKKIAEEIYEILEDDIVEEVASSFDEMEIAYDLIDGYRSDFIETAREVIVENIGQEINVDDVSDHLKEIAVDKIDEL